MSNWVKGIYKKELPNRFRCEVDVGGKTYMCYQPLSFKLNKIMDPEEKEVLLTKINKEDSDLAYIVYAIGIDKKNYALLNLQLVNQIFRDNIDSRKFLFLGKRSNVICEKKIERLKTDLYVQDTNTVIEVKTIFSFEKEVLFPNIKSYRIQRQIEELTYLLEGGYRFSGTLKSSEEGKVFWLDRKDIDGANLIWNMRELLEIFETDQYSEFFFEYKNGKHEPGKLLG